ncbi:Trichome birefringence-like family [Parasponia andersonii]|uniref:Trichome birefringence-like family n=1 Tax=Parasponia andersonii TaxID=3476 RepID=A0A2P5E0S2_PARAD|nr:Trichome birefringence-like family [Parasponia andersonii]
MKPHDHPFSSSSSSASSVLKRPRQLSHYLFSLLAFIVFVTILYSEDFMCIFSQQLKLGPDSDRVISGTDLVLGIEKSEKIAVAIGKTEEGIEKEKEKEIPFAIVKTEEKEKEKEKISNAIPKTEEWIEKEEKEKIPSAIEKTHEERIEKKTQKIPFAIGKTKESCNIFSGRWVWDECSRPLYQESDCPYIQPQLTCLEHGRPDRNYQHWRWQPHGCDLPKSIGWGGKPGGNCYNETSIIEDPNYWGSDRKSIMQVLGQVFSKSKYPVTFLNITQLSNYRKDAHTSIYKKQWNPLTPEQIANPVSYADCVHWCLPGLQDTWNELLFAKLFYP